MDRPMDRPMGALIKCKNWMKTSLFFTCPECPVQSPALLFEWRSFHNPHPLTPEDLWMISFLAAKVLSATATFSDLDLDPPPASLWMCERVNPLVDKWQQQQRSATINCNCATLHWSDTTLHCNYGKLVHNYTTFHHGSATLHCSSASLPLWQSSREWQHSPS